MKIKKLCKRIHFRFGVRRFGETYYLNKKRTEALINFIEYELWEYFNERSDYLKLRARLYELMKEARYDCERKF